MFVDVYYHDVLFLFQVILWMDVLQFEKTNPAKLNAAALKDRMVFTFKQALACVRFYPEVWYVCYI